MSALKFPLHTGVLLIRNKSENDAQVFGKVCPWNTGKRSQLVPKLGLARPNQMSLRPLWHVLQAAILLLVGSCLHNRVYLIHCIVQPSTSSEPEKRNSESATDQGDDTQVKTPYMWRASCILPESESSVSKQWV